MPSQYIESVEAEFQHLLDKKSLGVRTYSTNRNYQHVRSLVVRSLLEHHLSWHDCKQIHQLFNLGCKKNMLLCQRFGLTKYYLNKVLNMITL